MQPFASSTDFQDALGVLISEFTGQSPGLPAVADAAVNVLSYAVGTAVGQPLPAGAMAATPLTTPQQKAAFLQGIKDNVGKMKAGAPGAPAGIIPWATLIPLILSLLSQFLPWLKPPVPAGT